MDFRTQLNRFLNRRVCLNLWGRTSVWGTLISIEDEYLRLLDTIIVGEAEEGIGWYERMQYGQDDQSRGPCNAETIVRLDALLHVTCADDNLPAPVAESTDVLAHPLVEGSEENNSALKSTAEIVKDMTDAAEQSQPVSNPVSHLPPTLTVTLDRIGIDLGVALLPLAIPDRGGDLLDRIGIIRKDMAAKLGVLLPRTRVKDRLALEPNAYQIRINGYVAAQGELHVDQLLALEIPAELKDIEGIDTIDPVCNRPAKWVHSGLKELVTTQGGFVAEPAMVLASHFASCIGGCLHEVLSYQDVWDLIDDLRDEQGQAIEDLVPQQVSITRLHRILRLLLEEHVPIRNLLAIIQSTAYHGVYNEEISELLRRIRIDIGREICGPFCETDGKFNHSLLDATIEASLLTAFANGEDLSQHPDVQSLARTQSITTSGMALVVRNGQLRRSLFQAFTELGVFVSVIAAAELPNGIIVGNRA